MQISIIVTGSKETRRKLEKLGDGILNMPGAMKDIGERLTRYYSTVGFLSQGGVYQKRWAPLSLNYARRKARMYPGRPPLVKTGKMISGFRYDHGPQQVRIYNRMPHFKYHQSTEPRSKIPRRATMGINSEVKRDIGEAVKKHIDRQLRLA